MSTFADLPVGAVFEFDHSSLQFHTSLAHGPWKKRTKRTYVYADNRSVQRFQIGTIRTKVREGNDCGGQ